MRYADGGGLTAEGRSRREQVRLQAAKMFAEHADARQIAWSLRVSTKSVYQWRRVQVTGLAADGKLANFAVLDVATMTWPHRRRPMRVRPAWMRPGRRG